MKSSETDILLLAGYEGAGPDHWQTRMASKLSTARIVEQPDWLYPTLGDAIGEVVRAVQDAARPIVFVTHSAGTSLLAHSIASLTQLNIIDRVKGAFLVAPPSSRALVDLQGIDPAFANLPRDPLPFRSVLIASSNDPFATLEESADLALAWGAKLIEAGEAGHINTASGHGPWPEGMMSFAGFLSRL
jgi:predicted alpha/beta hydrolase family esterase